MLNITEFAHYLCFLDVAPLARFALIILFESLVELPQHEVASLAPEDRLDLLHAKLMLNLLIGRQEVKHLRITQSKTFLQHLSQCLIIQVYVFGVGFLYFRAQSWRH